MYDVLFLSIQNFRLTPIKSQYWGQCYTAHSDHGFESREYLTISLNPEIAQVKVFAHPAGDEFWIPGDLFPYQVETQELSVPADCILTKHVSLAKKRLD